MYFVYGYTPQELDSISETDFTARRNILLPQQQFQVKESGKKLVLAADDFLAALRDGYNNMKKDILAFEAKTGTLVGSSNTDRPSRYQDVIDSMRTSDFPEVENRDALSFRISFYFPGVKQKERKTRIVDKIISLP